VTQEDTGKEKKKRLVYNWQLGERRKGKKTTQKSRKKKRGRSRRRALAPGGLQKEREGSNLFSNEKEGIFGKENERHLEGERRQSDPLVRAEGKKESKREEKQEARRLSFRSPPKVRGRRLSLSSEKKKSKGEKRVQSLGDTKKRERKIHSTIFCTGKKKKREGGRDGNRRATTYSGAGPEKIKKSARRIDLLKGKKKGSEREKGLPVTNREKKKGRRRLSSGSLFRTEEKKKRPKEGGN